jgi:hypothetical protein
MIEKFEQEHIVRKDVFDLKLEMVLKERNFDYSIEHEFEFKQVKFYSIKIKRVDNDECAMSNLMNFTRENNIVVLWFSFLDILLKIPL